ncbi:DUF2948 family protein [Amorphus orientalis]|uniref:DUF2948 domain-containing protein n=1 Tax=Amorphus orientalis TaxID=649198 RepID=A0AAE4ATY5_9HYPH|nr:DUF2948 family protein [Amorphus orientalis]MDQ0316768.1 hypothetical protein [Amorphus orientalis]
MTPLKLAALDSEDLSVVSAHVQDAVLMVKDLRWRPADQRFVVALNRYAWEAKGKRRDPGQRRQAVLDFARVTAARAMKLRRDVPDAVLSLLAVTFEETEAPAGRITLHFSGGGSMELEVECIEVTLTDLGSAWAAQARPEHDLSD